MLAVLFIALFLLILLGMDIAYVLLVSSVIVVGLSYLAGDSPIPFTVVPQYLFGGVNSFSYTAIPLFILAGEIMNRGGITDRLVEFSQKIVGHIRGGVAQTGVVLNVFMAGVSGSAVADCAATGSVLIPAMKKDGYTAEKSAAVIATASTIGPVFPPSIPMIIIGSLVGLSVGKLFIAGIVPGILMGVGLMAYISIYAKRKNMAKRPRASFKEQLAATKNALLTLGLPVLILYTIMAGIASPTESAVMGVLYALILTVFVYRTIKLKDLFHVLMQSSVSTGSIMITVAGGVIYGWIATYLGIGDAINELLTGISDNKYVILLVINLILLLLGMVLEAIPIILLMAPILFPIASDLGIDPIHFSVIIIVNLMIGLVTPPIGLHLFITSSIAKVPISGVIKSSLPFVAVLLVVLLLVTYFPEISMFLPNLLNP